MIKFVQFIKKIYVLLLFVVLEVIAFNYYANSTSYTKAKLLSASDYAVGGIYKKMSGVGEYFSLRRQNQILLDEVVSLRNTLATYTQHDSTVQFRVSEEIAPYFFSGAQVINNSITRQENYITLDKGLRDNIEANMAVITPDGAIAGYVLACSEKYAVCMSILNKSFRTSGKFKGEEYFGSVYWDGLDHQTVLLSEIPKYAEISVGDTIVTTDYSAIFPPELMIGTVISWELNNSTYFDVKVRLAAPIAKLRQVIVVKYQDAEERMALENEVIKLSE